MTRTTKPHVGQWVFATLFASLAMVLAGCTPSSPVPPVVSPSVPQPDGKPGADGFSVTLEDVTVTGAAGVAPSGTMVHLVSAPSPLPTGLTGLAPASQPMSLTLDGGSTLGGPVTINWNIPAGENYDPATLAFLSVDGVTGTWSGLPATVSDDVASVTTPQPGTFFFAWGGAVLPAIVSSVTEALEATYAAPSCAGKTATVGGLIWSASVKPESVDACVTASGSQAKVSIYSRSPFVWLYGSADGTGAAPAATKSTDVGGYAAIAAYSAMQKNGFDKQTALVPHGKATLVLKSGLTKSTITPKADTGLTVTAALISALDATAAIVLGHSGTSLFGTMDTTTFTGNGECLAAAASSVNDNPADLTSAIPALLSCAPALDAALSGDAKATYDAVVALASSSGGPLASQLQDLSPQFTPPAPVSITVTSKQAVTAAALTRLCKSAFGSDTGVTGSTTLTHQAWGHVTVATCGPATMSSPTQNAGVIVVDDTATVRWSKGFGQMTPTYTFALAKPATDKSGNLFIVYNPGRYDGIAVLRPSATGMTVIAGGYDDSGPLNFYYAELHGPGADGLYTIRQYNNDCIPDCATGKITSVTYKWNGTTYVKSK